MSSDSYMALPSMNRHGACTCRPRGPASRGPRGWPWRRDGHLDAGLVHVAQDLEAVRAVRDGVELELVVGHGGSFPTMFIVVDTIPQPGKQRSCELFRRAVRAGKGHRAATVQASQLRGTGDKREHEGCIAGRQRLRAVGRGLRLRVCKPVACGLLVGRLEVEGVCGTGAFGADGRQS